MFFASTRTTNWMGTKAESPRLAECLGNACKTGFETENILRETPRKRRHIPSSSKAVKERGKYSRLEAEEGEDA